MKIYFWGSGKIGLKSLGDAEKIGILPDGFIDSDSSRWGSSLGGIKIYSPDILYDVSDINVFITCAKVNEVKNRLMSMGISEQSIFEYNSCELFFKLIELQARHCLQEYKGDSCHYNRIFFELQNGWVLGGVESWAYEMASMLRSGGYRASLLLSENSLIRRPYPHSNMLSLLPDVSECDTLEMPEVAPECDTLEMPEAVSESDTKETLESAPAKSKPRAKTAKAGTSRAKK